MIQGMWDKGLRQREQIAAMPMSPAPAPWREVATEPVGGLLELGFGQGESAELLMVISAGGRAVFDAATGRRVARDEEVRDLDWYDPIHLRAEGIGPLGGQSVRLCGLHGGGLPRMTEDGWSLTAAFVQWPDAAILLQRPSEAGHPGDAFKIAHAEDPRAWGFSETGRVLVIAEAHALRLLSRSKPPA